MYKAPDPAHRETDSMHIERLWYLSLLLQLSHKWAFQNLVKNIFTNLSQVWESLTLVKLILVSLRPVA